jgi:predicted RNA-binding Zn ribbon-like protein
MVLRITESDLGYRLESTPLREGWSGIGAEEAAYFGCMLADGDLSRLRICDNPDCQAVNYDDKVAAT